MAQVRRAVSTPIAADEGCTDIRSALALIKAEACDVFVVSLIVSWGRPA